jgi:hypothetical protein
MLAPPPRPLTRSRQKVILVASLVTALVEIAGLMDVLPHISLGRLVISPSIFPAFFVVGLLGRRIVGRARDINAAATYWLTAGAGLFLCLVLLDREGHVVDWLAIVIAALDEEIVYRFAVPAIVAAVLVVFQVPSRPSRVTGLVVAAVWFVLLPGHRMQWHTPADVAPFIAFAALSALVVYRSGSILATAATHAVMNMLTIIAFGGDMSRPARSLATGVLLILLVSGYSFVRPGRAEQPPEGDGTVIDLRDGSPLLEPVRNEADSRPRTG